MVDQYKYLGIIFKYLEYNVTAKVLFRVVWRAFGSVIS